VEARVNRRTTILLAIAIGVALEVGIGAMSGRREAWDSGQYWSVGLPFASVAALLLGYFASGRNWRWAILIVPAQLTAMMVKSGGIGTLWPLMLVLGAVLSLPFVAVASLGARLRART
jgi:hypothetical protein